MCQLPPSRVPSDWPRLRVRAIPCAAPRGACRIAAPAREHAHEMQDQRILVAAPMEPLFGSVVPDLAVRNRAFHELLLCPKDLGRRVRRSSGKGWRVGERCVGRYPTQEGFPDVGAFPSLSPASTVLPGNRPRDGVPFPVGWSPTVHATFADTVKLPVPL